MGSESKGWMMGSLAGGGLSGQKGMLGRLEEAFEAEAQESAPDKENTKETTVGMVTCSKL